MGAEHDRFARVGKFYDDLVSQYGHDPRACDYGRPESQRSKFEVLAAVTNLNDRSILDVGCGFADYSTFLKERFSRIKYSGIDLSDQMVESALHLHPGIDVRKANILDLVGGRTYDVVTANGIFYLLGDEAWPMMCRLIEVMFSLATRAVAFNSLSTWASDRESHEFYADPSTALAFCRTLTPWVVCRHDYHSRDFTIYLYRDRV